MNGRRPARSDWTITGTRAGGAPFSVSRSNLWGSLGDVTVEPAEDFAFAADALVNNEFENVTIDNVTFGSDMATKFKQLHITKLEVARPGGKYASAESLAVQGGRAAQGPGEHPPVPRHHDHHQDPLPDRAQERQGQEWVAVMAGGLDLAGGGEPEEGCLFEPEGCSDDDEGSLDKVIKGITSAPKNNAIVAQFDLESEDSGAIQTVKATKHHTLTVTGGREILIAVR